MSTDDVLECDTLDDFHSVRKVLIKFKYSILMKGNYLA